MKTNLVKPMLAASIKNDADLDNLPYPVIVQPKLDGIRCLLIEGMAYSRKLLPIPNDHIRHTLAAKYANLGGGGRNYNDDNEEQIKCEFTRPKIYDGELIIEGKSYNEIQSAVMSKEGKPAFTYKVFDILYYPTDSMVCSARLFELNVLCGSAFSALTNYWAWSPIGLLNLEQRFIEEGYEGIIIRSPNAPYKTSGARSTLKSGPLWKLKRFQDAEARILGFKPMLMNLNQLEMDNLGYAKRSSHQDNKAVIKMAGVIEAIVTSGPFKNTFIEVGTGEGLTHELRKELWATPEKFIGRTFTFKYQPHGTKNKPRMPIWKGLRDD